MKKIENNFYDKLKCEFEKALKRDLDKQEKEFLRWIAKRHTEKAKKRN